jgi:DNA-binding XRE family transcriptional regulator
MRIPNSLHVEHGLASPIWQGVFGFEWVWCGCVAENFARQMASLISWHRRRAGLSQIELARHAGVSRYVVQDLEAGAGRTTWARMLPVLRA